MRLTRDAYFFSHWDQRLMKSASYERCRWEEGHNSYPLECRLSAGRLFRQKPRKYCQLDTQASWWCQLQSTCFWIRVLLHKICFFVPLYQIFVSTVTFFENEVISDNTGESVFQFLLRYGCKKSGKIERLDAYYMVESWRFKMFI